MIRPLFFAAALLLPSLPTVTSAQDVVWRGGGVDLSYVAADEPQTGLDVFATSDQHLSRWVGLQADAGFQHLAADGQTQTAAWIDLHTYARLRWGIDAGAYVQVWASDDPATAAGLEISWQNPKGFSAEAYFGETWGDELSDGGSATSKGATIGYTFANDVYAELFFNKDTTSESGIIDRDYYD